MAWSYAKHAGKRAALSQMHFQATHAMSVDGRDIRRAEKCSLGRVLPNAI